MDFADIKETENKYGIKTGRRQNLCFVRGDGNRLWDTNGKEYIDFVGGLGENCLGYANPLLTAAIAEQAAKLINCSSLYYSEPHAALSKSLIENTIFNKAFICSGQVDAFICLITMISRYCKLSKDTRKTILAVSDNQYFYSSEIHKDDAKFEIVPYGDYDKLKEAFNGDVCAVVISPIMFENGVTIMDNDYVLNLYAMAKSAGAIIAIDETGIGFGRTGELFAFEHYGIMPDLIALSKGLGGGIIIGAVLLRKRLAQIPTSDEHLSRASALECEAANVVVSRIRNGLETDVKEKGKYLEGKLSKLSKYNFINNIRGIGLIHGIELSPKISANKIVGQMEKRGYLISCAAKNTLRLTPPFTITYQEIDLMTSELMRLFSETNV